MSSRSILLLALASPAAAFLAGAPMARAAAPALRRPAFAAPVKVPVGLRMMADEAATEKAAEPVQEVCVEDEAIEECTLVKWDAGEIKVPMSWARTARLGVCFFAWFFLNVMYNITNKKCQNAFPMPWTMTVVSLFVGVPYILLLWASGIRKAPKVPLAPRPSPPTTAHARATHARAALVLAPPPVRGL